MIINTGDKIMFTRQKDVKETITFLFNMIDAMSSTLEKVTQLLDMDRAYSYDYIVENYKRIVQGPNVIEEILIKEGKLTLEECQQNYFERNLLREIAHMKYLLDVKNREGESNNDN